MPPRTQWLCFKLGEKHLLPKVKKKRDGNIADSRGWTGSGEAKIQPRFFRPAFVNSASENTETTREYGASRTDRTRELDKVTLVVPKDKKETLKYVYEPTSMLIFRPTTKQWHYGHLWP